MNQRVFTALCALLTTANVCGVINQDSLDFGLNIFPTAVLDLDKANSTDTKCVTYNGKELCSTIDSCSKSNYVCYTLDGERGHHSCSLSGGCSCTATYDGESCDCSVNPMLPYKVYADIRCGTHSGPFDATKVVNLDSYTARCNVPAGLFYPSYTHDRPDGAICTDGRSGLAAMPRLAVDWKCPALETLTDDGGVMSRAFQPDRDCTCTAVFNDTECQSCEPCPSGYPGDFRVSCDGFFTDCHGTFSVWNGKGPQASSDGGVSYSAWDFVPLIALALITSILAIQ
ncbi:unnamed protein product [Cylindrotheca closterium]|uniref:EGF-like domain-containing protein n=1 Tax=Cylindrotheca closterium TaxID=2856 RepID=A0AAD2G6V0_9STRA|nr:unnamed protein product [Cylindrotheca closterium]